MPLPAPTHIIPPGKRPASLRLNELQLEPKNDWIAGMRRVWAPGTVGAGVSLKEFTGTALAAYNIARELPGERGTSRLSPHLHFGEISVRQVWHELQSMGQRYPCGSQYLAELGWREFAHHLIHHFPHTINRPLRQNFARFPWRKKPTHLKAWQRGKTGYPMVDAGMRELWTTGWMHNRVRMVTASFLVKHLLIDWRKGAEWFWDTLVDADLASNTLGWQWTAGCGADAAPYFRIFNPVAQGEKFDRNGDYIRRWVPELRKMHIKMIHKPWTAPPVVLQEAGVELGQDYPLPIVDHQEARRTALSAVKSIKQGA